MLELDELLPALVVAGVVVVLSVVVALAFDSPVPASTFAEAVLLPLELVLLVPLAAFRSVFKSCVFWLAVPV